MAVTLAILPPSWVPGKQSAMYTVHARGRDAQAAPLLWRHEEGPWACRHTSLDRLQRVWRTGDVHSSFKTKLCTWVPLGRSKSVHEFRRLA